MRINTTKIIFLLAAFFLFRCKRKSGSQKSKKPNIIILLADDMGYGDLQSYGNPNIKTPYLDSLAADGIRFTSYMAAPWCVPSRAELMTGDYIPRINLNGSTGAGGHGGLADTVLTLAKGLKQVGYATGMAGKWHLGYDPKKFLPTNRGFDSWLGLPYSNDYKKPYVQTDVPLVMYRNTNIVEYPVNQDSLTIKYTRDARRFIHAHSGDGQPFFFYLAYNMPHLPIHTTKEFFGKSEAGFYGDVVETIDWSVGQVLKALDKTEIAQNTIVFFASDNGPWNNAPPRMFNIPKEAEGGNWELRGAGNKPWYTGSTGPLRGSKNTTWEGGPRVPAIIRWPGHIATHQVSKELATNLDIYRTLMEAGGATLPDYTLDGYNIMPYLTGRKSSSPRNEYAYFAHGKFNAFRAGKWKLRIDDKKMALYNLNVDVSEKYNVASIHPEILSRLKQKMDSIATEMGLNGFEY